jgi:4-amino-4-deoxy-L-arabinose transferase-like glycosyltransferase
MELEKLKELWDDSNNSSLPINEEGLSKILNQDSRRPIALIKRNLKLEVLFVILLYGFLIWLILNQVDSNILYVDIILLVLAGILFCVYAFYKNKLLNKMECVGCEVKSNLNLQLNSLEKLVKLYFKVGNIGVVFVYLIAGAISFLEAKDDKVQFPHALEIIIFLSIGLIISIINYYISRWYIFNLYGKHIQKLKNILYEMDESDSM